VALPTCAAQGRQTVEGQVCTSKHEEAVKHTHRYSRDTHMIAGHTTGREEKEGGSAASRANDNLPLMAGTRAHIHTMGTPHAQVHGMTSHTRAPTAQR
jgi:hypothetical protein